MTSHNWKWDTFHEMYLTGSMNNGCGAFEGEEGDGTWYGNAVYNGDLELSGPLQGENEAKKWAEESYERMKNEHTS